MPSPDRVRVTIGPLLRHTRLCTFTPEQLCKEVIPTRILTKEEYAEICIAIKDKTPLPSTYAVSGEIDARKNAYSKTGVKSFVKMGTPWSSGMVSSNFDILTRESDVELLSIFFESNKRKGTRVRDGINYQCEAEITITKNQSRAKFAGGADDVICKVTFSDSVEYNSQVEIDLRRENDRPIVLQPHRKYIVKFVFREPQAGHRGFKYNSYNSHDVLDAFVVSFNECVLNNRDVVFGTHLKRFDYKVLE